MMGDRQTQKNGPSPPREELYTSVLKTTMDGFWMTDLQGRLLAVNDAYCRMSGYGEAELLDMSVLDLEAAETQEQTATHIAKVIEQGVDRFVTRHRRKDGSVMDLEVSAQFLDFEGGRFIGFFRDITEEKRAEELLHLFKESVENSSDAVGMSTPEGKHFYQNDAFTALFGRIGEEPPGTLYVDKNVGNEVFQTIMDGGRWDGEVKMYGKERRVIDILLRAYAIKDDKGRVVGLVGIHTDITERKSNEEKIVHLNRIYALLSNVNKVIIHTRSRQQLFESICRIIIEDGKFRMAWIGLVDATAQTVRVVESNGYSEEYLGQMDINLTDSPRGHGPTATAIREKRYVVCNDIESDEIMRPWRERASLNGYRSSAAFPLYVFNTVVGALNIYSSDVNFFNEQETQLLDELALDISFALGSFEQEEQRDQAVAALRESEERFRAMFDSVTDGIILMDASNMKIITGNRTMCTMLGCREQELLSMNIFDLYPAAALPRVKRDLDETGRQKLTITPEVPMKTSDGSIFYVDISTSQVILDGKMHLLGVFRDVSERKRADEEQQKLLSIIESSSDLIGVTDLQGNLLFMNSAGLQLVGLDSSEEAKKKVIRDFHLESDLSKLETEIFPSVMHTGSWTGEIAFRHFKTGSPVPVDMNGFLIRDPATGRPLALANISRSIAERKRAEKEKQELQSQLLQAQRMESVGRLAGGVAHDFSNMLGVILGYTELALGKISPKDPLHVSLEEIRNAAERSAMLTQQLLAFARQQTIAPRVLNLNETIDGMLKMLKRLIGEDIDLAWQPKRELWPVKMDPAQLDQIFANLCVNARDAIEGVGKVTIETENVVFDEDFCREHAGFVSGDFAMLAVSDDGQGMDKETLGKIFDPFFTTKEFGKGTGLGLATVYGIVKQNDGFINVYSEMGIGTTFKIYLPRHIGATRHTASEVPREPVARGQETILLVEDEPALLELSKTALEMQGYRVLSAATPSQAISLAEEHDGEIHLLMTDVIMPEMNGRELATKLLSRYAHLKCLFTSGYTSDVIAHHGVLEEGVHFIPKPFSPHDLAAKVREALDYER